MQALEEATLIDSSVASPVVVYTGLGLAAASFLGTFLVLPQFKTALKEPLDWRNIYPELVKKGVRSISPEGACNKAKRGAVLLDVRLADKFNAVTPEGAVNVPLYQPIQKWDLPSNIRRIGFAFFGVYGTELNPSFLQEVEAVVGGNKKREVVVMCELGGTIESKTGMGMGFQSRSLKAIYFLQQAGYENVYHVEGGLSQWKRDELPLLVSN